MVYTVVCFLHKNPKLSNAEFQDHYENKHVPLVASRTDSSNKPLSYRRLYLPSSPSEMLVGERPNFDVVTELKFTDEAAFHAWSAAVNSGEGKELVEADMAQFLDAPRSVMCTATSSD